MRIDEKYYTTNNELGLQNLTDISEDVFYFYETKDFYLNELPAILKKLLNETKLFRTNWIKKTKN